MSPWADRIRLLAKHVQPGESVLDVGSGEMDLEKLIPPSCTYTPLDIARPWPGLDIDLDELTTPRKLVEGEDPVLPALPGRWNVAVCSGVLEHLRRPLEALTVVGLHVDRILLSYETADVHKDRASRERNGWKSHLYRSDLVAHADEMGWELIPLGMWNAQDLLELR